MKAKTRWGKSKLLVTIFISAVGLVGGLIVIYQFIDSETQVNVAGKWHLSLTVENTSYAPFQGLEIGYVIYLQQEGNSVSGHGEKWWENGEELPFSQHVPIELNGSIEGGVLKLLYELVGAERGSVGEFDLLVESSGDKMSGEFSGTAADSSGPVTLKRANSE